MLFQVLIVASSLVYLFYENRSKCTGKSYGVPGTSGKQAWTLQNAKTALCKLLLSLRKSCCVPTQQYSSSPYPWFIMAINISLLTYSYDVFFFCWQFLWVVVPSNHFETIIIHYVNSSLVWESHVVFPQHDLRYKLACLYFFAAGNLFFFGWWCLATILKEGAHYSAKICLLYS